jgi:hypothetical protein
MVTGCEDLSDEVFVFNAVPPPVDSASSARLPCRVLRQLLRDTPFESIAPTGASRGARVAASSSYRRRQVLECVK